MAGTICAAAVMIGAASAAASALVAVAIAVLVWLRDPGPDAWRAPVYLVLCSLPVSTVLTLLLAAAAGQMDRLVAWSALWREILVLGTLALALLATWNRWPALTLPDWCAIGLALLTTAYAVIGAGTSGHELSVFQRALGARAWLLPVALYFLGRLAPVSDDASARDLALLRRLTILVTLTAFAEFFLLGDGFWQQLDYSSYLRATGTAEAAMARGVMGNFYWIDSADIWHRRWPAFMGSLSLGYWYLAALPMLLAGLAAGRPRSQSVLILLAVVALVGSHTRAAMIGLLVAVMCLILIWRRKAQWVVLGTGALLVTIAAFTARPDLAAYVASALHVSQDPSTLGHLAAVARSVQAVAATPLGFGVGTSGYVGEALNVGRAVAGESLYLTLAAELGWSGAALWVGWTLTAAIRVGSFAYSRPVRDHRWALGAGLAAATLGYGLASVTTEVWRGLQASAVYWFLLGSAVSGTTSGERAE